MKELLFHLLPSIGESWDPERKINFSYSYSESVFKPVLAPVQALLPMFDVAFQKVVLMNIYLISALYTICGSVTFSFTYPSTKSGTRAHVIKGGKIKRIIPPFIPLRKLYQFYPF